jgi:hypothetical protein
MPVVAAADIAVADAGLADHAGNHLDNLVLLPDHSFST